MIITLKDIIKFVNNSNITIDTVKKVIEYLKAFGYLKDGFTLEEFVNAVKAFQRFFQLNETGQLDLQTVRALNTQRCGCADFITEGATGWGFGKNKVKASIHQFVGGLTQERQETLFIEALASIEAVCDIEFTYLGRGKAADINVWASNKGNGLGTVGNTLAYAYLSTGEPVDLVMDLAETWIDDPKMRGILYKNVICHEAIHCCGIQHQTEPGSLMNPYYSPNIATPQAADIRALQSIYGAPKQKPVPTPTPPNPTNTVTIQIVGSIESISIPGYNISKGIVELPL